MQKTPRQAAAEAGQKIYHSTPCHRGHNEGRYTRTGSCVVCTRESAMRSRERIHATLVAAGGGS